MNRVPPELLDELLAPLVADTLTLWLLEDVDGAGTWADLSDITPGDLIDSIDLENVEADAGYLKADDVELVVPEGRTVRAFVVVRSSGTIVVYGERGRDSVLYNAATNDGEVHVDWQDRKVIRI